MKRLLCWLSLSLVLLIELANVTNGQTLHSGFVEWVPYQMNDGKKMSGIVFDIIKNVSTRTGYTIIHHKLPQNRMLQYFREGKITLEAASNPVWRESDQTTSCYSIPYLQIKTVVLMKKENAIQATGPGDFRGYTLGCDLGYLYTDGFEKEFSRGAIIRDDTTAGAKSNFQKLASNRVQGIIIDRRVAQYWLKKLKLNPEDFVEAYAFKEDAYLLMRLHRNKEVLLPRLNEALKVMKDDGSIKNIIEKYTQ